MPSPSTSFDGLTQTLALEYADRGIRVNAIAPGATETPIQSWLDDEAATQVVRDHIPMRRIADPAEIARMVAFLASDDAAYVTGQTLFADGGLTLYADFQQPWSGAGGSQSSGIRPSGRNTDGDLQKPSS